MAERSVQIANRNGLHARPAAEVVKTASRFQCDITISRDDLEVNGKSIMGVMMLAASRGTTVILETQGEQEAEAMEALVSLINNRFDEGE